MDQNKSENNEVPLKIIYSEKATKFCKIFTLHLTLCTVVKSKVKISQNFVAFSEYMNFTKQRLVMHKILQKRMSS